MTTLLERMRNAEKEATEPKPETDTSGAMRVEVSGMGGPERPSNLVDLMRQWNKNAPKETTEQQTTTKPSKQKLTQAPSEDWKIKPERQAELDKGRIATLQQELANEQQKLSTAKPQDKPAVQSNIDAIRRELVSAGFKNNIGAPKGRSEIDMVNPDRADTISVAPTRPQQSNELVNPANKASIAVVCAL
jgi:capsule polysaccharide export protein KpsE/RkpR